MPQVALDQNADSQRNECSTVTIYRQPGTMENSPAPSQVALKLPFAFSFIAGGNAYDFSRDLSTVIYARVGGHADLFLISQK